MNRDERDRFTARTDQSNLAYAESACLETPPDVFQALHREFHFDVDLAANEQNHLLPRWFGPNSPLVDVWGKPLVDALAADWMFVPTVALQQAGAVAMVRGFCNPSYGAFLPKILLKALEEAGRGFTSVFLLPLRASRWYREMVLPYADEVRHTPRMTFWYKGQPRKTAVDKRTGALKEASSLFDSIIVVFRPTPVFRHHCCPHFSWWDWRTLNAIDQLPQEAASSNPYA